MHAFLTPWKTQQKEARALAKQKKRRLKKKYRVLRGIYAAVVAVAAVIVIGYGVYKVAVPAPERADLHLLAGLPGPGQRQCRCHHAGHLRCA